MLPHWARVLIGYPVLQLKLRTLADFRAKLPQTRAVQEERLRAMLTLTSGSAFARDFGLQAVKSVADFQKALPIAPYERMAPYIERVRQGEVTALFRRGTKILMFASTSGTTAAMKTIPVTQASLREYRDSWTVFGIGVVEKYPNSPYAGVIHLPSNWRSSFAPSGVPTGSITGLLFETMHSVMRFSHVVPPPVANLEDQKLRYYLTLRLGLQRRDTALIISANPSSLITFARRLDEWRGDLLKDLHDGTLLNRSDYPVAVRRRLSYLLKKDPQTARRLDRVVQNTGHLYPKDAWKLALLCVWQGGTLSSYLQQLPQYYGALPLRDHGLSASEARMTIPLEDNVAYGVLNVAGSFYEFIPESEREAVSPRVLLAHELEPQQNYYIVLTTSGGLFRYDISDVVRCEGFNGTAPLLTFLHKGSQIANLTGEKLSAFQVTQAVSSVQKDLDIYFGEYIVAPSFGDPAHYHLLIEQAVLPSRNVAAMIVRLLDAALQRRNMEYRDKRQSGRLGQIVLTAARNGTFQALRQRRLDAGTPPEQYKHPFLIPDQTFADSVRVNDASHSSAG